MPQKTAHETYLERLAEVESLIEALRRSIESHKAREQADSRNWGFAGDLGKVIEGLEEIILP